MDHRNYLRVRKSGGIGGRECQTPIEGGVGGQPNFRFGFLAGHAPGCARHACPPANWGSQAASKTEAGYLFVRNRWAPQARRNDDIMILQQCSVKGESVFAGVHDLKGDGAVRKAVWCVLAMGTILLLAPTHSLAFTCGGSIIDTGDLVDVVVAKCGEPNGRRVVKEEVTGQYAGTTTYQGRGRSAQEGTLTATVEQTEVLTYNCGEGRLIHILTFKAGKLQKVQTSGHGVGPRRCD